MMDPIACHVLQLLLPLPNMASRLVQALLDFAEDKKRLSHYDVMGISFVDLSADFVHHFDCRIAYA